MSKEPPTTTRLDFSDRDRNLIERAATLSGKTTSEFVVDASLAAAQEAILDQLLVRVDDETFRAVTEILQSPPHAKGTARLVRVPKP